MADNKESTNNNDAGRLKTTADLVEIAGRLTPATVVVSGGDRVEGQSANVLVPGRQLIGCQALADPGQAGHDRPHRPHGQDRPDRPLFLFGQQTDNACRVQSVPPITDDAVQQQNQRAVAFFVFHADAKRRRKGSGGV